MEPKNYNTCVGLFGTCGGSKWREPFIAAYEEQGIEYFNPQVDDWDPSLAEIEAEHLAKDGIILFPVTGETYGTGSLAETGFSVSSALRMDSNRYIVTMIERELDEELDSNPDLYKESLRARALVSAHLAKAAQTMSGLYVVNSLDSMLDCSLELHDIAQRQECTKRFRIV